jgi:hypothetical protein
MRHAWKDASGGMPGQVKLSLWMQYVCMRHVWTSAGDGMPRGMVWTEAAGGSRRI